MSVYFIQSLRLFKFCQDGQVTSVAEMVPLSFTVILNFFVLPDVEDEITRPDEAFQELSIISSTCSVTSTPEMSVRRFVVSEFHVIPSVEYAAILLWEETDTNRASS